MSNILQAHINIVGTRPLLWHHFGADAIPLEAQEKTGRPGNDPEEWRRTYLATPQGQLFVKPSYVFASLRAGAFHTKKGKGSILNAVAATLQVIDDKVLVDRWLPVEDMGNARYYNAYHLPVYIDVSSVVNRSTKGRNVRYRVAAAAGWTMDLNIMWDKTIVSRNEMEAVARDAGRLVGIADGRQIGFGRFLVAEFCVMEVRDAPLAPAS